MILSKLRIEGDNSGSDVIDLVQKNKNTFIYWESQFPSNPNIGVYGKLVDTSVTPNETKVFYFLTADKNYVKVGSAQNEYAITIPQSDANYGGRVHFPTGIQTPDNKGFLGKTYVYDGMSANTAYYLMAMDTGVPTFNKFHGITSGLAQLFASRTGFTGPVLLMSNVETTNVTKSASFDGKTYSMQVGNANPGTTAMVFVNFVADPSSGSSPFCDVIHINWTGEQIELYLTLPNPNTVLGRTVKFFTTANSGVNMATNLIRIRASGSSGYKIYRNTTQFTSSPSYYLMQTRFSWQITAITNEIYYFLYGLQQT